MSTLLKWAQNTQGKLNSKNNGTTNGEKKWIHPAEALQKGHVAYLVKFLGNTVVDQPKGIEVVKEGIRKLRFSQQLRKSETGAKTRKVELTISVDGVAIQEPRTHVILHQFPLHRISYCADDKGEKKFFSFIAKQPNQNNELEDKHECFVFISDKLAEEITLTIGQAFELAYKRFLDTSGKDLEAQRRAMLAQQRAKRLEDENNVYKQRLLDLSKLAGVRAELDQYLKRIGVRNILEVLPNVAVAATSSPVSPVISNGIAPSNGNGTGLISGEHMNGIGNGNGTLLDLSGSMENLNGLSAPPVPPRTFDNGPAVGTKLENLLLNELDNDNDFNPRSFENNTSPSIFGLSNGNSINQPPLLAPPPKAARRNINNNTENLTLSFGQDLFGSAPFSPNTPSSIPTPQTAKLIDPFEMGDFGNNGATTSQDIENAIGLLDKRILEMKTGFSRGISFGNEDFSLESLDPLKN